MAAHVVVLGAGYAGAGAIKSLERHLDDDASITWVADVDYHLVLHEAHRCIRDPDVASKITIPVQDIKAPGTTFHQAVVDDVDPGERAVHLADGSTLGYDYLVVALGSRTAFYGIPGLEEHAYTLKRLEHAEAIHDAVAEAAEAASIGDPARVVVGGAGLSGIQVAGEVTEYRDEHRAPIEVTLIEGLEEVLPMGAPPLQRAIRRRLEDRDVVVETGSFVDEVTDDVVTAGEDETYPYDVLVWTGGITGREALRRTSLEKNERSYRIEAGQDFRASDERVFAIGDCALIDQPDDEHAPPTAQAAWQAAEVAGENVARTVRGDPLETWRYEDMGTVVSIGESAVAHDVSYAGFDVPMTTFDGYLAKALKKSIAAKWIRKVAGTKRAVTSWSDM